MRKHKSKTGVFDLRAYGLSPGKPTRQAPQTWLVRLLCQGRHRWYSPFPHLDASHLPSLLIIAAEHTLNWAIAARLIDLLHPVPLIAQMPSDIPLNESLERSLHVRIFALENGDELLTRANGISRELVKSLVQPQFPDMAVIVQQACLVPWIVEFFVEGHHVVDENDPLVHLREHGRNLREQGLFVELRLGEDGCADGVAQAVQAAEEEREVLRPGEAVEVVLLDPAALEDCEIGS